MPKRRRPTLRDLVQEYERFGGILPSPGSPALPDPDFTSEMELSRDDREYRMHLRRMRALPYEEAVAEIDWAIRADREDEDLDEKADLRIMLVLDVRYRPNYWLSLKSEAARRRDKRAKKIIEEAERRFNFDEERARPGRPRVDAEGRRNQARPHVLADLPEVAAAVKRIWRDHDRGDEISETPKELVDFAVRFLGVPEPTVRKSVGRTWRRRSLDRKALAVHLLHLKWSQRFPGLRESDVAIIITPAWRRALAG